MWYVWQKKMSRKKRYWNDSHIHIVKKVIRNKELHLKPKYVWNCRLHLNDDCNFFSWPFDFFSLLFFSANCSIFLHIFFLVICSKRFALFFFLSMITLKKRKKNCRCTPFATKKKRMEKVEKLQRKSLTFLWSPQETFLRHTVPHCWVNQSYKQP